MEARGDAVPDQPIEALPRRLQLLVCRCGFEQDGCRIKLGQLLVEELGHERVCPYRRPPELVSLHDGGSQPCDGCEVRCRWHKL